MTTEINTQRYNTMWDRFGRSLHVLDVVDLLIDKVSFCELMMQCELKYRSILRNWIKVNEKRKPELVNWQLETLEQLNNNLDYGEEPLPCMDMITDLDHKAIWRFLGTFLTCDDVYERFMQKVIDYEIGICIYELSSYDCSCEERDEMMDFIAEKGKKPIQYYYQTYDKVITFRGR